MELLRYVIILLWADHVFAGKYHNRYSPRPQRYHQHRSKRMVRYPRCHKGKTLLEVLVVDGSGAPVSNADITIIDDKSFFKKDISSGNFQTDNSGIAKFFVVGCEAKLIISKNSNQISMKTRNMEETNEQTNSQTNHQVNLSNNPTARKREIVVLDGARDAEMRMNQREIISLVKEVLAMSDPLGPPDLPSGSDPCLCGLANRAKRIIGGRKTEMHEYPWQVAIFYADPSLENQLQHRLHCGGSVIADQWILTAAHCLYDGDDAIIDDRLLTVVLGVHDLSKLNLEESVLSTTDEDKHLIMKISNSVEHGVNIVDDFDFALLKLESPIDWTSYPNIRPICLPDSVDTSSDGKKAIVTGWGNMAISVADTVKFPDQLREVTVKVISNRKCQRLYKKGDASFDKNLITDDMICAGVATGGKDICQGDIGGPLITTADDNDGVTPGQNYHQIGVASWEYNCGIAEFPGVYARVTSVLDWIETETMGSFNSCPRM